MAANGRIEEELACRVGEVMKLFGARKSIWKRSNVRIEAKIRIFEKIVVLQFSMNVLYEWILIAMEKHRVNITEIKCLKTIIYVM